MLKKIDVRQLQLGMHLHRFEGAWVDHPFWRTRFVIDDAAVLKKAVEGGVRECWIDTARGLDVAAPPAADAGAGAPAPAEPPVPAPAAPPVPQTTALADELEQAARICKGARA